MSRKRAKSRPQDVQLRSPEGRRERKARTRFDQAPAGRADLERELEAFGRALAEALEQQAATSDQRL